MTIRLRPTRERWVTRIAVAVLAATALTAVFGRVIAPYAPERNGDLVADKLLAPTPGHVLGTDAQARDVLSRLLVGTQVSLGTAVVALAVAVLVGVAWGGVAAMAGGRTDRWMMRLADALIATPRLLILLAVVAFTGRIAWPALAVLIGATGWPGMSRLVRAQVRETATADFVTAARAVGVPPWRILTHHLLPAVAPVVLAASVLSLAHIIPLEAALTYFGAGVAPPTPSWGSLLHDASERPVDAWWLLVFPSAALAATVLCVNVVGERLQRVVGARESRP
jgi:ABC-type dipeptide/oligopeptide/nickel transport system permease subunit